MKAKIRKIIIVFSCFLLFSAGTVALVRPVYLRLTEKIQQIEEKYLNLLYEQTGLGVSYKSLSPSILSGINLRGVKIYDKSSGDSILSIKKVSIGYSLGKLLKKDLSHVFTKLKIIDVNFDYSGEKYPEVTEKLMKLFSQNQEQEQEMVEFTEDLVNQIKNGLFFLPFNVQIRNTRLHFAFEGNDISAVLNNIEIIKEGGVAISTNINGDVLAKLGALNNQSLGIKYNVNAKILNRVQDSSIFLSVDTHSRADYSLAKMEYLFRYGDGIFHLNSIQQTLPYDISFSYDMNKSQADVQISTDNLNPFALVKMPPLPSPMDKINGSRLSLDGGFSFNTKTLNYKWNAIGSVMLSRALIPSGERVVLNARGDNNDVIINSLHAYGEMLEASLSGTFNIPRLEPSITAELAHFTLPNGNQISGELYVEMQKGKYLAFIPQLFLGDKSFTAIQAKAGLGNNQIDFSFNMSDYAHYEYSTPAELSMEGLYQMGAGQEVQLILDVKNLFADSVLDAIAFCLDEESAASLMGARDMVSPFIMSTQIYLSTDFKDITYNSPYTIVANTKENKQALLLSFDGTQSSVQVSQLELLFNAIALQATINADIDLEEEQILFATNFNLNSIPYHLDGSFTEGHWLNITGNYGLDVMVNIGKELYGSAEYTNMPLSLGDFLFYSSLRTNFEYALEGKNFLENTFKIVLENFEIHENSGKIPFDPKISLGGKMDNKGLFIDSISYTDKSSSLFGSATADWTLNNSIIENINFNMKVDNPLSEEKVSLQANLNGANLNRGETVPDILDYKLLVTGDLSEIFMGRFIDNQYEDDTLNAFIRVDGTLRNPYGVLNIQRFRMDLNGYPINAGGLITFEMKDDQNWNLDLTNLYAYYNFVELTDLKGSMNLKKFTGNFSANAQLTMGEKDLKIPMKLAVENLSPQSNAFVPEVFKINLNSPAMTGSLLNEKIPLNVDIIRMNGMWTFTTNENIGANGYFTDKGDISLRINEKKPLHFNLAGNINILKNSLDIKVSDFYLDASKFSKYFNSSYFSLYSGQLDGSLEVSGVFTDPYLDGQINILNLDFNLPDFIPEHFTSKSFSISMTQDNILLDDCLFNIKHTDLVLNAEIILDRWSLDSLQFTAKTNGKDGIPIDAKVPLVSAKGNLGLDLSMSYNGNDLNVAGNVSLDNSEITVLDMSKMGSLQGNKNDSQQQPRNENKAASPAPNPIDVNADVTLIVGQKVHFVVNPIVRALIAPGTPINLTLNTAENLWTVKGDVVLRGGEVSYLNRNFYLKEGRIILNENQDAFDPNLTLRAETREHDEQGESVTITLSAIRQHVSNFNPSLYSTPAKSLNEIYELLGQAAAGDAEDVGGLMISALDYGVQVTVVRKLENALRDLFNFDIFSIRTAILQNAIKQGLNMDSNDEKVYSFSNYFDNSTVYIGKYFGESLYLDAMLHWTYDELAAESGDSATGLVFHPEIGLELSSPVANIRWNFAPDLGDLQNSWVSGNSITLSWRLSF